MSKKDRPPKNPDKVKKGVIFYLDKRTDDLLDTLSDQTDIPRSRIVREAIRVYAETLATGKKPDPRQLAIPQA